MLHPQSWSTRSSRSRFPASPASGFSQRGARRSADSARCLLGEPCSLGLSAALREVKDAYAKATRKAVSAPTAAAKHWAERSTTIGQGPAPGGFFTMPSATSTSIPAMGSAAFGGLETREPLTEAQIDGIARGLLAQLTLDEKIGMMHGDTSFFEGLCTCGGMATSASRERPPVPSRGSASQASGSPTVRSRGNDLDYSRDALPQGRPRRFLSAADRRQ